MAERDQIVRFCDEMLDVAGLRRLRSKRASGAGRNDRGDRRYRGLGPPPVDRRRRSKPARRLLLTHHGLFWDFHPRALSDQMATRLRLALGADLSLAGYHLPLDAHPEIGNNVLLCRQFGFEPEPGALGRPRDAMSERSAGGSSPSRLTELTSARRGATRPDTPGIRRRPGTDPFDRHRLRIGFLGHPHGDRSRPGCLHDR